METFFIYFIKVSVLVSVFYLSYDFLLKKETFFDKNRLFLLIGLITSVILPLITITKTIWIEPQPITFEKPFLLPDFSDEIITNTIVTEKQQTEIKWVLILVGFYVLGMLFFLIKFLLSGLSLYKILRTNSVQKQNGFRFIDSKNVKTPFSFFDYIAYDSSAFSEEELKNIISHEKIHCLQKHSIDVLLAEVFAIVFWLNPFVWLYKKAIQQNLEFIADNNAIQTSEDKLTYQKTLLKITINSQDLSIANPFYQPLIKKRIMMLNKKQSRKSLLWKYLVVFPLLVFFVIQFQTKVIAQEKKQNTKENIHQGKKEESALLTADTIVWVKDFAKSYDEWTNQSTGEKVVVKGGSWEDVKNHLESKPNNEVLGKNPLIILNGKDISELTNLNIKTLEFDGTITSTTYTKEEAIKKFGQKAKDGAIILEGEIANVTFQTIHEKELIGFLKTVKDYKLIDIYNRWGNLVYTLKPNEKLDEEKLKALEDGTYFYTFEKSSGEKVSGYLYKGDESSSFEEHKTEQKLQEREKMLEERERQVRRNAKLSDEEIKEKIKEFKEKLEDISEKAKEKAELAQERAKKAELRAKDAQKRMKERTKKDEKKLTLEDNTFTLTKNSTDLDIDKIKAQLQGKGIEMKVSHLKRNKSGEITKIKISLAEGVDTNNHKKTSKAEASFEIENGSIPDIYIGKRDGGLVVTSSK